MSVRVLNTESHHERQNLATKRQGDLRWFAGFAVIWAISYGWLRAWYAAGHQPDFEPLGTDLVLFTGWRGVGLCAAVAVVALALRFKRGWSGGLWAVGCAVSAAVFAACALFFLDLVGVLLWGVGIEFDPAAAISRLGCLVGGALLSGATAAYRRRWRGDCPECSRRGTVQMWDSLRAGPAPRWAMVAAHVAVAGMVIRLVAQAAIGFEAGFVQNASAVIFDIGFLLAGTVLPLALVYRWGRVWPRWVLPLAGRRVPRWLVAGPAFVLSGGITAYFGIGALQLLLPRGIGVRPSEPTGLSDAFFWTAVPAYVVWGVGLGVAAVSYYTRTRRPCVNCGC